jgi:hypothetical protein
MSIWLFELNLQVHNIILMWYGDSKVLETSMFGFVIGICLMLTGSLIENRRSTWLSDMLMLAEAPSLILAAIRSCSMTIQFKLGLLGTSLSLVLDKHLFMFPTGVHMP